MKTIILDASVIIKWFFSDEEDEKAFAIKDRLSKNEIFLVEPLLLYYEMNNILRTAIKIHRIEKEIAFQAYKGLLELPIELHSSEKLLEKSLELALKYDISSYDAAYVALADELKIPFITADEKLIRKVKTKYVVNLKDISEVL